MSQQIEMPPILAISRPVIFDTVPYPVRESRKHLKLQKEYSNLNVLIPLDSDTALPQQIVAETGSQRPRLQK